jgi:lysozyme
MERLLGIQARPTHTFNGVYVPPWASFAKDMLPTRHASDLIRAVEPLRLKAEQRGISQWVIGYGHFEGVRKRDTMTEAQALETLALDVLCATETIRSTVETQLTQGQFDAIVSWLCDYGPDAFAKSRICDALNRKWYQRALARMLKGAPWLRQPNQTSILRRHEEARAYLG